MAGAFTVGAIVSKLELNKKGWDASIKKVEKDQKTMAGFAKKNGEAMKKMGRTMTIAGAAILAGVATAVKAFAGFDKAMTESLAIMGKVSDGLRKEMSDAAKEMSTQSTFAAKELAEAYFFLASAGLDAKASIAALPVVTKFAQAGAFDLATATDLLTDAQTALGLSSKDAIVNQTNMVTLSDQLVKANTLANASVRQFAEALTNKAAAALVNVNKETEEGIAVLAAYADKGVKGTLAGQRLTMMINGMVDAQQRNTKEWENQGIAMFDAEGEMRSFADIIGDFETNLGTMTTEQKAATLATLGFNLRTKSSILTLLGSSEKIRQWTKDLKEAGGTTEEVAKKQLEAFSNKMTLVKNKITVAAIEIGEKLAPTIEKMADIIGKAAKKISEWIEKHPKLTSVILKVVAAMGALMAILGPLLMILPGIMAAVGAMSASFLAATGVITATIAVFGFTITKIIKLISVMKRLKKAREEANKSIKRNIETLKSNEEKLKDVATAAGLTAEEYENLKDKYNGNITALRKAIHVGEEGVELQEAMKATAKNLGKETKVLTEETEDLAEVFKFDLAAALKEAQVDLSNYSETITNTAVPATRNMAKVFDWAAGNMEGDMEDFGDTVEETFVEVRNYSDNLIDDIGSAFGNFVRDVGQKGRTLGENLKGLWNGIKQGFFSMIGDMVKDFVTRFIKTIITKSILANKAMEKTDKVFQNVGKSVADIGKGIGGLIEGLAKGIGKAIEALATSIANAARTLAAAAPQILIVGGVALALMAGFKAIQSLFGGGGKKATKGNQLAQDARNFLAEIRNELVSSFKPVLLVDMQARLDDHGQKFNWMVDQNKEQISLLESIKGYSAMIAANTKAMLGALGGIPAAATGGFFPQETLVRVAEKKPEVVGTVPMMQNIFGSGGKGGGGKETKVVINNQISPVFNTMDPMTMRDVWRKFIEPQMIESLSNKGRGLTQMKEALGLP